MYDPLGLAGPFTVRDKILMRHLWANSVKLDWDDPISEDNKQQWSVFFNELPEMNQVKIERCLKPSDAVCNPAKNRLAPIKKMSIDKIKLCGAVLSKRLKSFIDKQCRYTFEKCYYVVDSNIVPAQLYRKAPTVSTPSPLHASVKFREEPTSRIGIGARVNLTLRIG